MNCVGGSISSPSLHIFSRNISVFSAQPSPVPVMMASGFPIPESLIACNDVAKALFMRLPMRLD